MSNVVKLHNRKLHRVDIDVTKRYSVYVESNTPKDIDAEVKSVVDNDMYEIATDYKPKLIKYTYSSHYITCDESLERFDNEQDLSD